MKENQNFRYRLGTNKNLKIKIYDASNEVWIPTSPTTWNFKMTDGTNNLALTEATITYSNGIAIVPILGSATTAFTAGFYDWELKATDASIPESVSSGIVTALKKIA